MTSDTSGHDVSAKTVLAVSTLLGLSHFPVYPVKTDDRLGFFFGLGGFGEISLSLSRT